MSGRKDETGVQRLIRQHNARTILYRCPNPEVKETLPLCGRTVTPKEGKQKISLGGTTI